MATQPDLGIKNPYALDEKQFARRRRPAQGAARAASASTGRTTSRRSRRSRPATRCVGTTWQVIENLAQADKAPVKAILPEEGATGWSDTWMIASKAQAPELRLRVAGLHRQPGGERRRSAEYFGEAPSNAKACDYRGQGFCDTYHAGDEDYASTRSGTGPPRSPSASTAAPTSTCTDYSQWTPGLDRDQGLTADDRAGPRPPVPGDRARRLSGVLHRRPALRLGAAARGAAALAGRGLPRRAGGAARHRVLAADSFTGEVEQRLDARQHHHRASPSRVYQTVTLRTVGIAALVTVDRRR